MELKQFKESDPNFFLCLKCLQSNDERVEIHRLPEQVVTDLLQDKSNIFYEKMLQRMEDQNKAYKNLRLGNTGQIASQSRGSSFHNKNDLESRIH